MSQITLFCAYTLIYITRAKSDNDVPPKRQRHSAKATMTFRQSDHDIQPIAEPPYGVIPK